jgi:hypothetical protein
MDREIGMTFRSNIANPGPGASYLTSKRVAVKPAFVTARTKSSNGSGGLGNLTTLIRQTQYKSAALCTRESRHWESLALIPFLLPLASHTLCDFPFLVSVCPS